MITWENYEEYMMMHADGELNPAEEQALMAFVEEHPELKKDLAVYSMTRLEPDTTIVYEHKQQLLKEEKGRVIAFPKWQRYSIAAGVAALIFVSLLRLGSNSDSDKHAAVARVDTNKAVAAPAAVNIDTEKNKQVAEVTGKTTPVPASNNAVATATTVSVKPVVVKKTVKPYRSEEKAQLPVAANTYPINKISPARVKEIAGDDVALMAPAEVTAPALPAAITDNTDRETFFDKLPIDDFKKQNMKDMASAFATGIDKINSVKQEINETSVTLRVQKRKLIVSF